MIRNEMIQENACRFTPFHDHNNNEIYWVIPTILIANDLDLGLTSI